MSAIGQPNSNQPQRGGPEGTGAQVVNVVKGVLAKSAHPTASIFHVAFRLSALVVYLFGGILLPDSIVFILVIVLSAVDFWVVQKVTGRLLVGLKWQCTFNEDGTEKWEYQQFTGDEEVNQTDKRIFWGALFGFPAVWTLFLIANILAFDAMWMMCVGIIMALLVTNARGFFKCNKSIRDDLKGWAGKEMQKQAMGAAVNQAGPAIMGGILAANQQPQGQPQGTPQ